jgi:hypothetical protein
MLSKTPETITRGVSLLLLMGWAGIVASLLWDPFSMQMTTPDALGSPFRILEGGMAIQDRVGGDEPYPMGARLFWTTIIPIVPIFLMAFGHETWRRVCPLSAVSQIPRRLGWVRQIVTVDQATGNTTRRSARLAPDSWVRRNRHMIQFTLLALGVLGRTLFYNSERPALALAILIMLCFAFTIGLLFDGKAWCQNFCPASPVQSVYTGPGGLFDSKAHLATPPLRQSICRTPATPADEVACAGCTTNCSDIDLEASYWKSIEDVQGRLIYYGLFGLLFAFYSYFYIYAGHWEYYYSGVWTHERGQLESLWGPGAFIDGWKLTMPKIVVAPTYFLACILTSMILWLGLEAAWLRIGSVFGGKASPTQKRHQMLTICAFLCFCTFYTFAGRPNILLMPDWAILAVDFAIGGVGIAWTIKTLRRNPGVYSAERAEWREKLRAQSVFERSEKGFA